MIDITLAKIDLPKLDIPTDFCSDHLQLRSTKVPGYESYFVKEKVNILLSKTFPRDILINSVIVGQIIDPRLNGKIHKDGSRKYVLNYLIDSGGAEVYTCVYNEKKQIEKKIKQKPNDWIVLNTHRYHSIENVISKRIALSIGFDRLYRHQEEWFGKKIQN